MARPGVPLRHRLGQNFLRDKDVVREIADAADINTNDVVIEIGSGAGALTGELARRAFFVAALEIDERMLPILREATSGHPNVALVQGDALAANFDEVLSVVPPPPNLAAESESGSGLDSGLGSKPRPRAKFKVVANLPYYITTPILARLIEEIGGWRLAVVMVQKEVADRMAAAPGSKAYGALSILIQFHCDIELIRDVPPESFVPPPSVTSTVVRLNRRSEPKADVADVRLFFRLVRAAFSQRRKMLKNALTAGCPDLAAGPGFWEGVLTAAGVPLMARGEVLGIEDFARIANIIRAGDYRAR